ncbi:hypothetical protein CHCC20333_3668 [Bacillus paralicheniformis]|nr:hypothetical protein CHCC20333_3668 [Bacillus paralicheniformis]
MDFSSVKTLPPKNSLSQHTCKIKLSYTLSQVPAEYIIPAFTFRQKR